MEGCLLLPPYLDAETPVFVCAACWTLVLLLQLQVYEQLLSPRGTNQAAELDAAQSISGTKFYSLV